MKAKDAAARKAGEDRQREIIQKSNARKAKLEFEDYVNRRKLQIIERTVIYKLL